VSGFSGEAQHSLAALLQILVNAFMPVCRTMNIFGRRQYRQVVNYECRRLVKAGRLERRGKEGNGDPFTYHVPKAIP